MIKIHCRRKILHLPTKYSHEIQIKKGHFLQSKFSKKLQNLVYSMNAATHSSLCNKFLCVSDCPENDNNHASTYIRSSRPINYNLAKKSGKKIKIFEALNLLRSWWEKEQFQMAWPSPNSHQKIAELCQKSCLFLLDYMPLNGTPLSI